MSATHRQCDVDEPRRPRTSREVEHSAPAPLPDASRLPTPEEMAARLDSESMAGILSSLRLTFAMGVRARDAAILARLDAIAKAADDGRLSALTMLDALRAELRGAS